MVHVKNYETARLLFSENYWLLFFRTWCSKCTTVLCVYEFCVCLLQNATTYPLIFSALR